MRGRESVHRSDGSLPLGQTTRAAVGLERAETFFQSDNPSVQGLEGDHHHTVGVDHVDRAIVVAQLEGGLEILGHGPEVARRGRVPLVVPRADRQGRQLLEDLVAVDALSGGLYLVAGCAQLPSQRTATMCSLMFTSLGVQKQRAGRVLLLGGGQPGAHAVPAGQHVGPLMTSPHGVVPASQPQMPRAAFRQAIPLRQHVVPHGVVPGRQQQPQEASDDAHA